jgi:hypothetical protein
VFAKVCFADSFGFEFIAGVVVLGIWVAGSSPCWLSELRLNTLCREIRKKEIKI